MIIHHRVQIHRKNWRYGRNFTHSETQRIYSSKSLVVLHCGGLMSSVLDQRLSVGSGWHVEHCCITTMEWSIKWVDLIIGNLEWSLHCTSLIRLSFVAARVNLAWIVEQRVTVGLQWRLRLCQSICVSIAVVCHLWAECVVMIVGVIKMVSGYYGGHADHQKIWSRISDCNIWAS